MVRYLDLHGELRCSHNQLVRVAGPDNPCGLCEYEEYNLSRKE